MGKCCVRFNDKKGCDTKFYKNTKSYKTQLPDELVEKLYCYSVKYVEQLSRGSSPTSVASTKRFQKFQRVSEGLGPKALPGDYQNFVLEKKVETVKKLVDELVVELAAVMSHGPVQGVDIQADYLDNMQVGAGSARQTERTVREGVDMQVNNPSQIQVDEGRAAAANPGLGNTLSNDAFLQDVAWNQWDNPQGRPPSRPRVPLAVHVFVLNDLMHRASRFLGRLPNLEWSEESLRSFVTQLESLEGALEDDLNTLSRSREEEILPGLDFSYEDLQNVFCTPEGLALSNGHWVGFQEGSALPVSQLPPNTESGMSLIGSDQWDLLQTLVSTLQQ